MLMLMAQAAIAQSVAIAALPTFSAQYALGKIDEMRMSLASTLRSMFLLALPASVGLILLAQPIVAMLYQRGKFTEVTTEMTAWALTWYAAGLIGHSVMEVLTRAFYAQQDTKTPVLIGTIAMGLNVVFSFTLAWSFRQIGWMPHGGLALANSLATALEAIILFLVMRRRLGGMEGNYLARGFAACILASLGMGVALWFWIQATGGLNRWVVALGGVALGGVIYGVGVLLLRVPDIQIPRKSITILTTFWAVSLGKPVFFITRLTSSSMFRFSFDHFQIIHCVVATAMPSRIPPTTSSGVCPSTSRKSLSLIGCPLRSSATMTLIRWA
jgi:putative peptidoglycan lipid II flippase